MPIYRYGIYTFLYLYGAEYKLSDEEIDKSAPEYVQYVMNKKYSNIYEK